MREITRIHIAKIAYDIELDAKKELEEYIRALERYANDPEILSDIEIRITELLAERKVVTGGVIASDDVAAVRAQLGEPSEFASDDDGVVAGDAVELGAVPRRVYRDEDEAVLGGVLAGVAKFFGIDPILARLLFIALLIVSFGTALVLYIISWLVIPPARTAAEKLYMSGRPVTLASIKQLAGNEDQRGERAMLVRRALRVISGSLLVLLGIGGLMAIIAVIWGVQFGLGWGEFAPVADEWIFDSWWFMAMMGLFVVSGLLFSALCFMLASAVFRQQWTKRIGTSIAVVMAAGLVVFAVGVSAGMYGYTNERARIADLQQTETVHLPQEFMSIKTLIVGDKENSAGQIGAIEYVVSDTPRFELNSMPGVQPLIDISEDGLSATVWLIDEDNAWRPWIDFGPPILRVYGPALDHIDVTNTHRTTNYFGGEGQKELGITIRDGSLFRLFGTYDKVAVSSGTDAEASLETATIGELYTSGGSVTAGVVRQLNVKQPDVCAAFDLRVNRVEVKAVSGGKLFFNDKELPAESIKDDCGEVIVGDRLNGEGASELQ